MHTTLEGQPNPHCVATSKSLSHSNWSEKIALNAKNDLWCPVFAKGIPIPLTLSQLISKRVWRETVTMSISDQPITTGCAWENNVCGGGGGDRKK